MSKDIYAFTDGSCILLKKERTCYKAGIGVYITGDSTEKISISQGLVSFFNEVGIKDLHQTNQRAELSAIYKALLVIGKTKKNIIICSDSMYSIKSLTVWIHKWKTNNWNNNKVKNRDIIEKIDKLIGKNVSFVHVNSHRKRPPEENLYEVFMWKGNKEADELATTASKNI